MPTLDVWAPGAPPIGRLSEERCAEGAGDLCSRLCKLRLALLSPTGPGVEPETCGCANSEREELQGAIAPHGTSSQRSCNEASIKRLPAETSGVEPETSGSPREEGLTPPASGQQGSAPAFRATLRFTHSAEDLTGARRSCGEPRQQATEAILLNGEACQTQSEPCATSPPCVGPAGSPDSVVRASVMLRPQSTPLLQNGPLLQPWSGACANAGPRKRMEDCHTTQDNISGMTGGLACQVQSFYAVFDGHGGKFAAEHSQSVLLLNLLKDADFPGSIPSAVKSAFLKTDLELKNLECQSGTTALAVLLLDNMLYVANTGDCRAVMSHQGRAVDITKDHRVGSLSEKARVMKAGGTVDGGYLNGELAVTRALGDWHLQGLRQQTCSQGGPPIPGPLIAEPEIFEHELDEGHEFLVLASDGLWDVFQGQSRPVMSYARQQLLDGKTPEECARALVDMAMRQVACADNVSAVVVSFSGDPMSTWVQKQPSFRRFLKCKG